MDYQVCGHKGPIYPSLRPISDFVAARYLSKHSSTYCECHFINADPIVTTWHFSRSFHFYFIVLTLVVTVQSIMSNTTSHSLLSISPSNFVSDHQRKSNSACIQSQNVANTTLKLQRTARFKTRHKRQDYLIVRQNDRTSHPL